MYLFKALLQKIIGQQRKLIYLYFSATYKNSLLFINLFCYFKRYPKTINIGRNIKKHCEEQDLTRESMAREMEINLSGTHPSPPSLAASEAN